MFSLKEFISAFATILFITIIFSSLKFYYNYFTRPNPYKGPFPLPLIGNFHQIFYHRFNTPLWFHSLHLKYGDVFEIYNGSKRQLITNNLQIIEHVMKPVRNSNYLSRLPPNEGLDELGLSKGIVMNRDINKWAYNRKIFIRAAMAPNALKFSANIANCVFKDLEIYWDSLIDEMGESTINQEIHQKKVLEIDLVPWINRIFTETIMLLATNRPPNTLLNYYKISKKDSNIIKTAEDEYLDSAKYARVCMLYYMMIPSYIRNLPLIKFYSSYLLNKFSSRRKYIYNVVKEHRHKIENINKENLTSDLLNMLLTINTPKDITQGIANDFNDEPMNDEEINNVLAEAFGAGTLTSSAALSCLIYYTLSYPEVEQNILKEIKKVFGDKSNLDYEDLKKLEYIEAAIKEVLRINPLATMIDRESANFDQIGDYKIPGSTRLSINVHSLHMNPNYWNEPTKFNPSRFLNKNHDNNNGIDEDSFIKNTLFDFGGGLRICPGRHLAMNQIKLLVALLYKKYKFELVSDKPIGMQPFGGSQCVELKVKLTHRN